MCLQRQGAPRVSPHSPEPVPTLLRLGSHLGTSWAWPSRLSFLRHRRPGVSGRELGFALGGGQAHGASKCTCRASVYASPRSRQVAVPHHRCPRNTVQRHGPRAGSSHWSGTELPQLTSREVGAAAARGPPLTGGVDRQGRGDQHPLVAVLRGVADDDRVDALLLNPHTPGGRGAGGSGPSPHRAAPPPHARGSRTGQAVPPISRPPPRLPRSQTLAGARTPPSRLPSACRHPPVLLSPRVGPGQAPAVTALGKLSSRACSGPVPPCAALCHPGDSRARPGASARVLPLHRLQARSLSRPRDSTGPRPAFPTGWRVGGVVTSQGPLAASAHFKNPSAPRRPTRLRTRHPVRLCRPRLGPRGRKHLAGPDRCPWSSPVGCGPRLPREQLGSLSVSLEGRGFLFEPLPTGPTVQGRPPSVLPVVSSDCPQDTAGSPDVLNE